MKDKPISTATATSAGIESKGRLSRPTRIALYGVMLLSPLLLLAVVEACLRIAGYGDAYRLFQPVEGKEEYLYQNRDVATRYFAHLEALPTSLLDFFPAQKDSGAFRIFVQGGSSAAGFPFYYGGAFSRMLEQRLAQTFPDRRIEVINTAMAAVNSYTMLDFVPEILEQSPDAILIYAGHNEYYGALGVGSSESFGRAPWLKRTYLGLRKLRTVQALRALLASGGALVGGRGRGEVPNVTMMSQMVGEQRIPYESPLYHAGLEQFRSNMARLLARYRERAIPVFVATLASNEGDHRPFLGEPDAVAMEAHRAGMQALGRGRLDDALGYFREAVRRDSLAADSYFAMGEIHEQRGNFAEARHAYLAAKDRDALRFRAPETMNDVIRALAGEHDATVVEAQAHLAKQTPGGIIGDGLMTEHLHPNVEGYFLLADAFYEALIQAAAIPGAPQPVGHVEARREVLLTPVDSIVGMLRIQKLKASWPFQAPGVVDRSMDTLSARNPVQQIALDLWRERVTWREANEALRTHYESTGNLHGALQAALAQIQEFPLLDMPYLYAGNILVRQGRYDEAHAYFENALAVQESGLAHRMLGSILLNRGAREAAVAHLERAIFLSPEDVPALYNLAGAHALSGRRDEAERLARRVLEISPGHPDARRLLESLRARNAAE